MPVEMCFQIHDCDLGSARSHYTTPFDMTISRDPFHKKLLLLDLQLPRKVPAPMQGCECKNKTRSGDARPEIARGPVGAVFAESANLSPFLNQSQNKFTSQTFVHHRSSTLQLCQIVFSNIHQSPPTMKKGMIFPAPTTIRTGRLQSCFGFFITLVCIL